MGYNYIMLRKLGKSITVINAIAFVIVIFVGGVSIFLTKDILHNAYKVEDISKDIILVNDFHSDSYRLIIAIHHFLIEQDEEYAYDAIKLIHGLKEKVKIYKESEEDEYIRGVNPEMDLLNTMLNDIEGLKNVSILMDGFSKTGKFEKDELISLEEFAYSLEESIKSMNQIHLFKIQTWTNESLNDMWLILFIYMIFILIGGISIYAGYWALMKRVVAPIKELASATIEFARGKLDKRVSTDSQTEIGQLYESFNQMAQRLQVNDKFLRKFNDHLERKVQERTTELQETNTQLKDTQNVLVRTEKIAAVGQIAAGVTHEIKNPLNSLSINTQMLSRDLIAEFGPDSPSIETANLIKYEINRINTILEEFVKFAKFPEPQFFDNNMNEVIMEIVDLITESAKDTGVSIKLLLHENIPSFKFDARQFKEVLINIAQNAVKAMKNGGELEIETAFKNKTLSIRLSDNGDGISEKNMQQIFTPFYSTKTSGMGLGLAIVQRIVESHGGKISCTSSVGSGTTFNITIPVIEELGV